MMMDGNSRNNKLLISVVSLEFSRTIFTLLRTISLSFYVRKDRGEMVLICTKSTKFVVKVLNMKWNLGACEQLRDRSRQGGATGPRSGREQVC